jgi:hypothetical protein
MSSEAASGAGGMGGGRLDQSGKVDELDYMTENKSVLRSVSRS